MDHVTKLIERNFSTAHGELRVGTVSAIDVAADFETPLYVYGHELLERKWRALRAALPEEFAISFSVKANPTLAFLQYFLSKGCGLEVASGGEMHRALESGCDPLKIVFAGPG